MAEGLGPDEPVEAQFYRRLYDGGRGFSGADLAAFEREKMGRGKRYALVLEDLSGLEDGGVLAELGCGGAEALRILAGRGRFTRIVGVDVAALPQTAEGIELVGGNLNAPWPFADGEVDRLIALMLIEHLFDPFFAFHEVARCLSANGRAYVNLPLVTGLPNRLRLLAGRLPETSVKYHRWFERRAWDGNHLHYFSMPSVRDLAADAGLAIEAVRGVGRFHQLKSRLPSLLAGEVTMRLAKTGDTQRGAAPVNNGARK